MRIAASATLALLLAACNSDTSSDNGSAGSEPFMAQPDPSLSLPSCELLAGTIGVPDLIADPLPLPDQGNGLAPGAATSAPADLPAIVVLRNDRQTFNRRYEFALDQGRIWYRSHAEATGISQPWASLPMPACLAGNVIGISVDDDELMALRADGKIYGMDNALKEPLLFNWSSRWGPPVWTGTGRNVPDGYLAWSWSVISPVEDQNWTDPAGNRHAIGQGKVSHIWLLRDGGQRFTFIDPWLPKDDSYEMCGPQRGRFIGLNLSASGSAIATVNSQGDIYTRFFDFDLSGDDALFFTYSYDSQQGVSNPAIQLPGFDWVLQPSVPGRITQNLSMHKTGVNMIHRVIRVEGLDSRGRTGYWERDVADPAAAGWHFTHTGEPLRGAVLATNARGTSADTPGPTEDMYFVHKRGTGDNDWFGELLNFNVYCTPARLRVQVGQDPSFELLLHTTDVIRQTERARGLDNNPRGFSGAIEIPATLLATLENMPPDSQAFIQQHLQGKRFTNVMVSGITGRISLDTPNWNFVSP